MGGIVSYVKNTNDAVPDTCTYCNKEFAHDEEVFEFYPHEAGGYCIFAPRFRTDYSCKQCAYKTCESCGSEKIRYGFIECTECGTTHCYNNTDMKYENNPMLRDLVLCPKYAKCVGKRKREDN